MAVSSEADAGHLQLAAAVLAGWAGATGARDALFSWAARSSAEARGTARRQEAKNNQQVAVVINLHTDLVTTWS